MTTPSSTTTSTTTTASDDAKQQKVFEDDDDDAVADDDVAAVTGTTSIMDHPVEDGNEYQYSCPPYRILVWPDSLQCVDVVIKKKPGFLIGWSASFLTQQDGNADDDPRRFLPAAASSSSASYACGCLPLTLVVAGFVQQEQNEDDDDPGDEDDDDDGSTKQQQQQQLTMRARIEDRIRKIQTRLLLVNNNKNHSSFSQPPAADDDDSRPRNKTDKNTTTTTTSSFWPSTDASCWKDLRVIAWYDPDPAHPASSSSSSSSSLHVAAAETTADAPSSSSRRAAAAKTRLPCISLVTTTTSTKTTAAWMMQKGSSYQYYPWFVLNHHGPSNLQHNENSNHEECQVIFYKDDDSTIYSSSSSTPGYNASASSSSSSLSFYSLLLKITNASQIMKLIQSSDDEATIQRLGDTAASCNVTYNSPDRRSQPEMTDPSSSSLHEMDNSSFWRRACRFVYKRSFFLRILRQLTNSPTCRRAIPLLRFVDALNLLKQIRHQQQQQEQKQEPSAIDKAKNIMNDTLCCWPDRSKHVRMHRLVHCWDEVMLAGLDSVMGTIIAVIIIRAFWLHHSSFDNADFVTASSSSSSSSSSSWTPEMMIQSHFLFLWKSTVWLESFPIGFKLNELLTANLGHKIRSLMTLYQWLLQILTRNPLVVQTGAAVMSSFGALAFGAFGFVALVLDVFRCAMVHVSFFAYLFGSIVRAELYLLAALWRLFRGKKRNPLRRRTDTMEYDSLQLLVGIIVFSVSLFLFTTIGIYHAYFAALNLAMINSVSFTCILMCTLLWKKFPWGRLLLRCYHPGWFTSSVYLAAEMHHHDAVASTTKSNTVATSVSLDVTRLQTIPCSYSSILMDGLVHRNPTMRSLIAWLLKQLLDPFQSVPSLLHDDDHSLASVFETLMGPAEGSLETTAIW
jgi:N-acetylglucosaminyl transferase component (Gpi1)